MVKKMPHGGVEVAKTRYKTALKGGDFQRFPWSDTAMNLHKNIADYTTTTNCH